MGSLHPIFRMDGLVKSRCGAISPETRSRRHTSPDGVETREISVESKPKLRSVDNVWPTTEPKAKLCGRKLFDEHHRAAATRATPSHQGCRIARFHRR